MPCLDASHLRVLLHMSAFIGHCVRDWIWINYSCARQLFSFHLFEISKSFLFSGYNLLDQRAQLSAGVHLAGAERGAPRAGALHVQRLQSHRDPGQDQRRTLASDGNQVRRITTLDKSQNQNARLWKGPPEKVLRALLEISFPSQ